MIVPDSFKFSYEAHRERVEAIKAEVDSIFKEIVRDFPGTVYSSRIKSLESTFTKAMLGKYEAPFQEMEDFLACTLAVPTLAQIPPIKAGVLERFHMVGSGDNSKVPDPCQFIYSDFHIILAIQDSPLISDRTILERHFELQIKTWLQSAWAQAGHDIVYKPSKISWGVERIASEMRALLELADAVLAQIEETAGLLHGQSEQTFKSYHGQTKQIIEIMESNWEPDTLPRERRRMAEIIREYMAISGISADDLNNLIRRAKQEKHGVFGYLMLSPMQQAFILIYQSHRDRVLQVLKRGKHRVLVTEEMADLFPELKSITLGVVDYRR